MDGGEVDDARGNVARNDRVCKLLREQPYIPEFLWNIKAVPRPKLCAGTKFDYYLFVRGIQLGIYLSFGPISTASTVPLVDGLSQGRLCSARLDASHILWDTMLQSTVLAFCKPSVTYQCRAPDLCQTIILVPNILTRR